MFCVCYLCGSYYTRRHHFLIIDSLPIAKKVRAQTSLFLKKMSDNPSLPFKGFPPCNSSGFFDYLQPEFLKREPSALASRPSTTQTKWCVVYEIPLPV